MQYNDSKIDSFLFLFSENKNKQNTKLKMQIMIEEVIQELASQYAKRIIDHHLGEYDLEEGEIINVEWSLEDMRAIAKRIVMRGNIANTKEPIVTTYDEVYGSGSI